MLEDTCLNQHWYSNNNKGQVVTILALKHGVVLEGDENQTFELLIIFLYKKKKKQLKALRGIPKAKVKYVMNKVNCVHEKIDLRNLTELNDTMYAVTAYVTEQVGANKLLKTKKKLKCKRRLEKTLKELNRDLDFVNNLLEERNII